MTMGLTAICMGLGQSVCGEVRIAYRIPDSYMVPIKTINENITFMYGDW